VSDSHESSQNHERYVEELCASLQTKVKQSHGYIINTIYFGGGTPSFIDAQYIVTILETIRTSFTVAPDAEITIECNPNSITREKLEAYKCAGINRISIGVQSFRNKTLRVLGRVHDVRQARNAIKLAGEYFDNVSIDLIHSVPSCKVKISRRVLKSVKHVSAYALTSDKYEVVSDERSIKDQTKIEKILHKYGIEKYEISNFARIGYECKHNLTYWECGEWLGFGEGAKSHFNEPWSDNDKIMMGLRLVRGVPQVLLESKMTEVRRLAALGLLKIEKERVMCTGRGFMIHNQVLGKLLDF